jgi:hypothetical protein
MLTALALSAWIAASVVAFLIVAYTSFFGIAVIGLIICYISTQFELDGDRPVGSSLSTSFLGAQLRAQQELRPEQRRSVVHEQSLSMHSARFFKFFGFGLIVIGVCGGVYYQL